MEVDRWRRTASAEAGYGQAHTDAGPFQFSDGGAGKGIQTMEVCDSAQDRKHCVKNLVLDLLVRVVCKRFFCPCWQIKPTKPCESERSLVVVGF